MEPSTSIEELEKLYLETLSEKEKKSYDIAKDHLGMSFQLDKSVGFLKWKKNYDANLLSSNS